MKGQTPKFWLSKNIESFGFGADSSLATKENVIEIKEIDIKLKKTTKEDQKVRSFDIE